MSSDGIEVEAVVGKVPKNATTEIVARLTVVHGHPCVDVRVFAHTGGGEPVATRQGIALARDRAEDLRELVNDLCDAACGGAEDADAADDEGAVPVEV